MYPYRKGAMFSKLNSVLTRRSVGRASLGGRFMGNRRWILAFSGSSLLALSGTASAFAEVGRHLLPDGRVFEQVSPVDKNESDVRFNSGMDAAFGGDGLAFTSDGSFAGQPTAQFQTSYLARRGAGGWVTRGIQMPNGRVYVQDGYTGYSADLSEGVIRWMEDTSAGTYDPAAVPGLNMYMRDEASGAFQLLNGTLSNVGSGVRFVWGSADFGKIGFETAAKLTTDSPCNGRSGVCAYEWDHGTVRLASVLPAPENTPVKGGLGDAAAPNGVGNTDSAVSSDGSRVFFSTGTGLYAREDGVRSTLVSGSERTAGGGVSGQAVHFQGAEAAHGDRVIFTTTDTLLDADRNETSDLYLYDFTKPAGERLSLLSEDLDPEAPEGAAIANNSPGNVPNSGGVLARSDALDRVYFVAENEIVAGGPEAPGPKLYVWDDTGVSPEVRFIASLSPEDARAWDGSSVQEGQIIKPARISSNGRYIAFISVLPLTAADHDEQPDVYRYDAQAQELACVSCSSDASPSVGSVRFDQSRIGENIVNHLPRNVSDSGQVFFQTSRGLVPADSNGKVDVYEYENGGLFLLSGGSGIEDSYFLDASASGNDVFFDTRDQLVGWDEDANYDAYDARVGGGLPEPPPPGPPCEGDSCQPAPVLPNDPTPASLTFNGPGNITVQGAVKKVSACPKGKVRVRGKCQKKPRKKRRQKKHIRRKGGR
jgi:hypothetical protein